MTETALARRVFEPEMLGEFFRWLARRYWEDVPSPLTGTPLPPDSRIGVDVGDGGGLERAMIEWTSQSDFRLDDDGFYVTPLRAAIGHVSTQHPMMGRLVHDLCRTGFDWVSLTAALGMTENEGALFTAKAIQAVYRAYRATPIRGL